MGILVDSSTWHAVRKRATQEIAQAQLKLEQPSLSPIETEYERGRIAGLRDILKLAEKPVLLPDTDPMY